MIRVTNTGVSSSIAFDGTVEGRIRHGVKGVLDVAVTPRTGTTWYARTGNWPTFGASALIVGLALFARMRERQSRMRSAYSASTQSTNSRTRRDV